MTKRVDDEALVGAVYSCASGQGHCTVKADGVGNYTAVHVWADGSELRLGSWRTAARAAKTARAWAALPRRGTAR